MNKKPTTSRRNDMQRKLAAYSALAITAAMGSQADAQVLYTDVDPDFIITEPTDPPFDDLLSVDLNSDGSPEGIFVFSSFVFDGSCYTAGSMSFYFLNYASVLMDTASSPQIRVLDDGEIIGESGNWDAFIFQPMMYSDFFVDICDADLEYPNIHGAWTDLYGKNMGIRFQDASSNTHYGYIRLTVLIDSVAGDAEVEQIRIHGFAYEETPDLAIEAGAGFEPDAVSDLYPGELAVYPNPALDDLFVAIQLPGGFYGELEVVDLTGRVAAMYPAATAVTGVIHVGQLRPGMYLLRAVQNGQPVAMTRFIKQ